MARTARGRGSSSSDAGSISDYDEPVPVRTVTVFLSFDIPHTSRRYRCSQLLPYQDMSTLFTSVRGNPPVEHRVRFYLGKVTEDKREGLQQKIWVSIRLQQLHRMLLIFQPFLGIPGARRTYFPQATRPWQCFSGLQQSVCRARGA